MAVVEVGDEGDRQLSVRVLPAQQLHQCHIQLVAVDEGQRLMLVGLVDEFQLFVDEVPHLQPLLQFGYGLLILLRLCLLLMVQDVVDDMVDVDGSVPDEQGYHLELDHLLRRRG